VNFVVTAVDAVDGPITTINCTPASGSLFPLGATPVHCTAVDSHGNHGEGAGIMTVVDTTPPTVTVPNTTAEATTQNGALVSFTATAFDIVDGNITTVTCSPASGSTFAINPPGPVTAVNCVAVDAPGNRGEGSGIVTVVDTTPPTIVDMPSDITLPPTSPAGRIVTWPPPHATDLVDGNNVLVTCAPPSGSLFPMGTTVVTCTARDAHNNPAVPRTFTVKIADSQPPIVTVTLNPGVLWPPNHKMVNIAVTVRTSDNDPNPACSITQVTSNQPVNGTGDGDTDIDWVFSGLRLQLRAERAGNSENQSVRVYTVTVSCTDSSGNVGTGTATAIVPHDMRQGIDGTKLGGLLGAVAGEAVSEDGSKE
jgi:hypothetical protein